MNKKPRVCYRCGEKAKRDIPLHDPIAPVKIPVCNDYPKCWPPYPPDDCSEEEKNKKEEDKKK